MTMHDEITNPLQNIVFSLNRLKIVKFSAILMSRVLIEIRQLLSLHVNFELSYSYKKILFLIKNTKCDRCMSNKYLFTSSIYLIFDLLLSLAVSRIQKCMLVTQMQNKCDHVRARQKRFYLIK